MPDALAGLPPGFDPYKTLQVDPEADPEVIQAAYRRLARKFHPDVAGTGSAERMRAINTAWEILQDPDRRAAYDRARAGAPRAPTGAPTGAPTQPPTSGWGPDAPQPRSAPSPPPRPTHGGPTGSSTGPTGSSAGPTGSSTGPTGSGDRPGDTTSPDWTSGRSTTGSGYDPATMRRADGEGAAGRPPGDPSGSVIAFGRYAGWSLGEISRVDVEYLEWLDRAPIGRAYRDELDQLLRRLGRRRPTKADQDETRRGLFRRR